MASYYRLQKSYYRHKPMAMAMAMTSSNLKRYMNSKGGKEFMERAPSTADIMKSMEEEKERQSQTLDQKEDKSKVDAPTPESVKIPESYKQDSSGDGNSQTGDTSHTTNN